MSVVKMHEARDAAINHCLDRMFTNGQGKTADRLVLTTSDGRDLGGWGRPALRDIVTEVYDAAARADEKRSMERAFEMLSERMSAGRYYDNQWREAVEDLLSE